jgi:hypothetical protein
MHRASENYYSDHIVSLRVPQYAPHAIAHQNSFALNIRFGRAHRQLDKREELRSICTCRKIYLQVLVWAKSKISMNYSKQEIGKLYFKLNFWVHFLDMTHTIDINHHLHTCIHFLTPFGIISILQKVNYNCGFRICPMNNANLHFGKGTGLPCT